jgi:hypothetical protein
MSTRLRRLVTAIADPASWGVAGERAGEDLPRGGARGSAWMAVAALLVGVVATPFGVDLGGADFGRLADGALQLQSGDGWADLAAPATVPAGAELRVGEQPARIEVDGGVLTLAAGTQLHAVPREPRVRRGGLLVEADESLRVRVGATTAEGRGQWRVDVGVASRVATYRARLDLDDGASQRRIGRFRQVSVRDGALEPGLRPLRYAAGDTWDEWLLADALAVDRLGERLKGTFVRSYGTEPRDAEFYAAFVAAEDTRSATDVRDLAVTVDDERFGPPADVLIGVAVTDALATEAGLATDEALERVVNLRRAGGTWGLALVEHDLGAAALRAAADRALQQAEQTPPPEPEAPEDVADDAPDAPVVPVESEQPTTTPTQEEGTPQAPASGSAPPSADDGGQDDVGGTGPVEDAVDDGGDTVDDVAEDPGGTVGDLLDEAVDRVDDAVRGLGSGLTGSDTAADGDADGGLLGG